jgi:4-amino-4-deoxy-L-arabinose transferase-like glycosyltransferase
MRRTMSTEQRYATVLALVAVFYAITNIVWIRLDDMPPYWDQARLLARAIHFTRQVQARKVADFLNYYLVPSNHPPLLSLLAVPFHVVLGLSDDVALLVNVAATGVLILSIYGIGRMLFGPEQGLLAAFIAPGFPLLAHLSRQFYIDYALTACVVCSIHLLLKTGEFRKTGYSILLGTFIGVGLLLRETYIVFVIGPVSIAALFAVSKCLGRQLTMAHLKCAFRVGGNCLLSLAVGGLMASSWYVRNWRVIRQLAGRVSYSQEFIEFYGLKNPFTLRAVADYLIRLFTYDGISFFYASVLAAVVVSLAYFNVSRPGRVKLRLCPSHSCLWVLIFWIVIPSVIFTFSMARDYRLIMPMLPALGLLLAVGILALPDSAYRRILISIVVLVGTAQFLIVSFGTRFVFPDLTITVPGTEYKVVLFTHYKSHALVKQDRDVPWAHPTRMDWQAVNILKYILDVEKERVPEDGDWPLVGIVPTHFYMNAANYDYFAVLNELPVRLTTQAFLKSMDEAIALINRCDYVVIKSGYQGERYFNKYNEIMMEMLEDGRLPFVFLSQQFQLPDNSIATIYKHIEHQ